MRTRILVVLTLALAATAGALYLTLTSDHEENPVFVSAVYLVVVWAFIATGLIAWARRPGNRFGPLMATVGFAFMLGALSESNNEYLFALGEILGGLGIAVFVLIFAGGALYTVGSVVYGFKRPNPWPRWFGFHEVFHSFTVLAFAAHYVGVSMATYSLR